MSDNSFAMFEEQVEMLPLFQALLLKDRLEKIIKKKQQQKSAEDGIALLNKLVGCVSQDISLENAKADYFAEKI